MIKFLWYVIINFHIVTKPLRVHCELATDSGFLSCVALRDLRPFALRDLFRVPASLLLHVISLR